MAFQKDFIWGVATASYQIEGGAYEADKGLNTWDAACKIPGKIFEGHTGDVACDHYHRFREDVALMKKFGIKNYRFSINWSRVIPEGIGKISSVGTDFYRELVKELKEVGITPWVTLFHWDYPLALQEKGGWLNPESPLWFEYFAETVVKMFGESVTNYMLINEPISPYNQAIEYVPEATELEKFTIAHHMFLACGRAEKIMRSVSKIPLTIGFAQAYTPCLPLKSEDSEAACLDTFACKKNFYSVNFWSDPLVFGKYPDEFRDWMAEVGFEPSEEDMRIIKSKIDFFGINTYHGRVGTWKDGKFQNVTPRPAVGRTHMNWTVSPESMYYGPKYIYDRYLLPIIYTENGVALTEWKNLNGEIPDDLRIDYVKRYLRELHRAAQEVPILGYFYWSLLDNFEWNFGYSKRFGLIYVDYDTMERTPKRSAYWYQKVIETNGEEIFR